MSTSTRTRKAPAKAVAVDLDRPDVVNHETGETADEVKQTYTSTATGRGGRTNTRKTRGVVHIRELAIEHTFDYASAHRQFRRGEHNAQKVSNPHFATSAHKRAAAAVGP
jgi:hypothetical protein